MKDNESARERMLAQLRAKNAAYVKLFGPPGRPTPEGEVVLADLDGFCAFWRESIHMDAQGRMDPYTTIYRDGKRAVATRIRKMIEWSESDGQLSSDDTDDRQ
jgi:hypothetical protein